MELFVRDVLNRRTKESAGQNENRNIRRLKSNRHYELLCDTTSLI